MLVQIWQVHLHENLELEAEDAESTFREEVEDVAELMLTEKRDKEPECILFMLL